MDPCNYLYNVLSLGLLMRKKIWTDTKPEILDEFWIAGWAHGPEISVEFEQCQHVLCNSFELHKVSVRTIFCILTYSGRDKEMELNWNNPIGE